MTQTARFTTKDGTAVTTRSAAKFAVVESATGTIMKKTNSRETARLHRWERTTEIVDLDAVRTTAAAVAAEFTDREETS